MTASWTNPSSTPDACVGPFSTVRGVAEVQCHAFVWESQTSSRYPRTRSSAKNGRLRSVLFERVVERLRLRDEVEQLERALVRVEREPARPQRRKGRLRVEDLGVRSGVGLDVRVEVPPRLRNQAPPG